MMALFNEDYIQRAYGHECELRGIAQGRAEGEARGRAQGLQQGMQQGMQQGQNKAFLLMQNLFKDGRIEDAKRAASDPVYQKQMMKEYSL